MEARTGSLALESVIGPSRPGYTGRMPPVATSISLNNITNINGNLEQR
jgi:hypothetical protein